MYRYSVYLASQYSSFTFHKPTTEDSATTLEAFPATVAAIYLAGYLACTALVPVFQERNFGHGISSSDPLALNSPVLDQMVPSSSRVVRGRTGTHVHSHRSGRTSSLHLCHWGGVPIQAFQEH